MRWATVSAVSGVTEKSNVKTRALTVQENAGFVKG